MKFISGLAVDDVDAMKIGRKTSSLSGVRRVGRERTRTLSNNIINYLLIIKNRL